MREANRARRAPIVFVLAVLVGCGGAAGTTPEAPKPKPRNAAALALSLVSGKASVLLFAERARTHPITPKVLSLDVVRAALEGTGIDPQKDLSRAFVTSPGGAHPGEEMAVLEHTVEEARLHAAIDGVIARSVPVGAWIDGAVVPEARVTLHGQTRVLAMPTPAILLVLPEARAADATRFVDTGGLPDPIGDEAAIAQAIDPATTLKAPHIPPLPTALRTADARIVLKADGSASVDVDAVSSSADQATLDAAELSATVDQATSVKIAFLTVRVFKAIPFHADGDHVKARLDLSASELDTLVGLAAAMAPR